MTPEQRVVDGDRIFTRPFLILAASGLLFYLSMAATQPVLPRFVKDELGGGDVTVGVVIGSMAISAICIRPFLGWIGDGKGRRLLIAFGAASTLSGLLVHLVAVNVPVLVAGRLLVGAGNAAFLVGLTTMAMDLVGPTRRGQAASYVLLAVHLGMGTGPFIGETALDLSGFDAVWIAALLGTTLCLAVTSLLPGRPATPPGAAAPRASFQLMHPAALGPGLVMASGLLGGIAFNTFLPLYGKDLGLDGVAPVLLVGSGTMVLIRAVGGRLPDRLGFVRGGTTAVGLMGAGVMIAALWGSVPGLYAGAVVMFSGSALLYPTLAAAADVGVPDRERSAVMASFTMFIDLSTALGGPLFGLIAAGTSYRGSFFVASCLAAAGLVLLHTRLAGPYRARLAAAGAATTSAAAS